MKITEIDTPAVLIDLDRAEANLARGQAYLDSVGLANRPHVKTHKLARFAQAAVAGGAVGITCQKLGEAEAMADAGLQDIFLPYNILGAQKLARLKRLHERVRLSVTADSAVTIDGYANTFGAAAPLTVLIECETGAVRCGVATPAQAADLAARVADAPGLRFGGLMTYPPVGKGAEVSAWLGKARALIEDRGLDIPVVTVGGTPDLLKAGLLTGVTEYRPGTYVYSDRMQVSFGHGTLADCALTVKATVVSRPDPDRAVLDAGSKALAADRSSAPGHGHLVEYPDAVVTALTEEHGVVDLSACATRPAIGEAVRVIPNHACVVSNLFDTVHLVRGDAVEAIEPVISRGGLQ